MVLFFPDSVFPSNSPKSAEGIATPVKPLRQWINSITRKAMSDSDNKPLVRNIAPFGLRLQPRLKRRLDAEAQERSKSLNSLISEALQMVYPVDDYSSETVILHLGHDLLDGIKSSAVANNRDVRCEITSALEEAYPSSAAYGELAADIDGLEKDLSKLEGDISTELRARLNTLQIRMSQLYRIPIRAPEED